MNSSTFKFDLAPPTDLPKIPDITSYIYGKVREIVKEIELTRPAAADLTEAQKWAILMIKGLMKWDTTSHKFISTMPVGIADDGNGGYIIGSYASHKAVIDMLKPTKENNES